MTTKTVDEWCAAQAGVIIGKSMYTLPDGKRVLYPFTLNDARCREIVREHYKLRTDFDFDKTFPDWVCSYWIDLDDNPECTGYGKTIAEAECNCITAIYEASQ